MIEGERYFFETGRRLFKEYANGKIKTFLREIGLIKPLHTNLELMILSLKLINKKQ